MYNSTNSPCKILRLIAGTVIPLSKNINLKFGTSVDMPVFKQLIEIRKRSLLNVVLKFRSEIYTHREKAIYSETLLLTNHLCGLSKLVVF